MIPLDLQRDADGEYVAEHEGKAINLRELAEWATSSRLDSLAVVADSDARGQSTDVRLGPHSEFDGRVRPI